MHRWRLPEAWWDRQRFLLHRLHLKLSFVHRSLVEILQSRNFFIFIAGVNFYVTQSHEVVCTLPRVL